MPLPFNLILCQLKPNTVSSVAVYHQKLGSRNETDPRKSKTFTCFMVHAVPALSSTDLRRNVPSPTWNRAARPLQPPRCSIHPIVFPKAFVQCSHTTQTPGISSTPEAAP